MALLKKTDPTIAAGLRAVAKPAPPKAGLKKTAAKGTAQPLTASRVSVVTAGGYTVYGSPVQPVYRTARQIADAIAELD
jgi:hypothetical protein